MDPAVDNKSRRPIKGGPPVRYTPEETREQLAFVEGLEAKYATASQIADLWEKKTNGRLTRSRVTWLIKVVRERWKTEDESNRPYWKARQIRSIEDDIRAARAKRDYSSVGRLQQLLAKIMGTEAPTRVEVDVVINQAIMHVIAGMPREKLNEVLEEERALEEDARRWRMLNGGETVAAE